MDAVEEAFDATSARRLPAAARPRAGGVRRARPDRGAARPTPSRARSAHAAPPRGARRPPGPRRRGRLRLVDRPARAPDRPDRRGDRGGAGTHAGRVRARQPGSRPTGPGRGSSRPTRAARPTRTTAPYDRVLVSAEPRALPDAAGRPAGRRRTDGDPGQRHHAPRAAHAAGRGHRARLATASCRCADRARRRQLAATPRGPDLVAAGTVPSRLHRVTIRRQCRRSSGGEADADLSMQPWGFGCSSPPSPRPCWSPGAECWTPRRPTLPWPPCPRGWRPGAQSRAASSASPGATCRRARPACGSVPVRRSDGPRRFPGRQRRPGSGGPADDRGGRPGRARQRPGRRRRRPAVQLRQRAGASTGCSATPAATGGRSSTGRNWDATPFASVRGPTASVGTSSPSPSPRPSWRSVRGPPRPSPRSSAQCTVPAPPPPPGRPWPEPDLDVTLRAWCVSTRPGTVRTAWLPAELVARVNAELWPGVTHRSRRACTTVNGEWIDGVTAWGDRVAWVIDACGRLYALHGASLLPDDHRYLSLRASTRRSPRSPSDRRRASSDGPVVDTRDQ